MLLFNTSLEYYGCYGLLRSVAVAEAERGKGIGIQLVESMLQQAKQTGIKRLVLLTQTAKDFFPRFGFRQISRADAPQSVTSSVEFQGACPVSATVMQLDL